MHVNGVTGATLDSQSLAGIQLSSSASETLNRQAPARLGISGSFDPALSGAVTAGLSLLQLQDVALNGQLCSLTGVQSLNASSPSPDSGASQQVGTLHMPLGKYCPYL